MFGEQRFGSAGNSDKIGNAIIKGNLEEAVKLFLTEHGSNERAQEFGDFAKKNWGSWKEILKKCPDFLGLEKAVLNWLVRIPTDFGGALRQIPKPTRRIFISAYQSRIWNKRAKQLSAKSCKLIKIPPIDIKRMPELSMPGAERQVVAKPKNLRANEPPAKSREPLARETKLRAKSCKLEASEIELQFELPKGVYATELIRALFSS